MVKSTQLVWSPLLDYLLPKLRACKGVQIIIAPFIQRNALMSLLDACPDVSQLRVITRWNRQDIASGVSDLEVYPYLRAKGVKLYLHKTIHLKLFVLDDNVAFTTSGNITGRGLGLEPHQANLEAGCEVPLTLGDWLNIHKILEASTPVDDNIFQKARDYKEGLPPQQTSLPELELTPKKVKTFSWLSLPASQTPDALFEFYQTLSANTAPGGNVADFMHDLVLYEIPPGLGRDQFFDLLKDRFMQHPFIKAVVELIKQEKAARFGLVNEWLQQNCSDKPIPYRWELKTTTRHLYDWLDYFYLEISWDRPGHSMILRWNPNP